MELLGITIPAYAIWLVVAVIFLIFEVITTALVSVWFIPGALVAALTTFVTDNALIQISVFLLVSLISFPISKKFYNNKLKNKKSLEINSMIGKTGLVVETLSKYNGRIMIGDVSWEARIKEDNTFIPEDSLVQVINIDKLTLIVVPIVINGPS